MIYAEAVEFWWKQSDHLKNEDPIKLEHFPSKSIHVLHTILRNEEKHGFVEHNVFLS